MSSIYSFGFYANSTQLWRIGKLGAKINSWENARQIEQKESQRKKINRNPELSLLIPVASSPLH